MALPLNKPDRLLLALSNTPPKLPPHGEIIQRHSEEAQLYSPIPLADYRDGGSFLLGGAHLIGSLTAHHPNAVHAFKLWQTFLDNIHPLTKLLHAPTMQKEILEIISDPGKISKSMEALMFSIYLAAVISMDDEECEGKMGVHRATLVAKYSVTAQQALIRAEFLKTFDIVVLQAFTIYLVSQPFIP